MEPKGPEEAALVDGEEGEMMGPSKVTSVLMIAAGILFLVPFVFVVVSDGLFPAFFTFGWTLGLGIVFLVFGWKRLQWTPEDAGVAE